MKLKLILIVLGFLFVVSLNPAFAQIDDKVVILHTDSGDIVIEFFRDDAPNHVQNFINLTETGFYDRTIFHRVIEDFMIQGGDPFTKPGAYENTTQWGTGNPGYTIDAEFNDIKHNRGIVSMARAADPNSAGSQFFVVHQNSNFLDGQYTVFGRIITQESFETLDKIATLETAPNGIPFDWGKGEILSAEAVDRSQILDILELDEPERVTQSTPQPPQNGEYSSDKFGFSSTFPTGWFVQEPEKNHPSTPDVVAVGPKIDGFNPTISITISESDGRSLEAHIDETKTSLQTAIDSGQISIISEEMTKIDGMNAFMMTSTGNFTSTTTGFLTIQFKEAIIETQDKFFAITYANTEENFDSNVQHFENTLDSFTILSNGGGCLIATATFGSELSPQVQQLRELRDNYLLKTESGSSFMAGFNELYYSFSPSIADLERQSPIFKEAVKLAITPLISSLLILNYVDMDSEAEVLGYGISLILLNIGLYVAAPVGIGLFFLRRSNFAKSL